MAHGRGIFTVRRVAERRRFRLWRILRVALLLLVGVPLVLLLLYRVLPPPGTPLMVIRMVEGEGIEKRWVALDEMSPHLPRAVIAAEDNTFCQHGGFDWGAIQEVFAEFKGGKRPRGASTISMQTSKNLFLWPGRDYLRKGLEVYLTVLLELIWDKRRILEVYLNVAEFAGGVYGAEAAARHYFGKPAKALSQREATLLATVLPNPRGRSAARPNAEQNRLAGRLVVRIKQIAPLLDCY
ncbi:MAG: monofunctional biosynthetic peptidoglycan transglycosylase [Kiloniellales bacterium]